MNQLAAVFEQQTATVSFSTEGYFNTVPSDSLAQEAISGWAKDKLEILKSKFRPSDVNSIKSKIDLFDKLEQETRQIKSQISTGMVANETITITFTKAVRNLPFSARTTDELISQMGICTHAILNFQRRAEIAKTIEELEDVKKEFKEYFERPVQKADIFSFNRNQALAYCDAAIKLYGIFKSMLSVYLKTSAKYLKDRPATESLDDSCDEIALEDLDDILSKMAGYFMQLVGFFFTLLAGVAEGICVLVESLATAVAAIA